MGFRFSRKVQSPSVFWGARSRTLPSFHHRWSMLTQLLPSVLNILPMSLWSLLKKKRSSMETTDGEQGAVTSSLAASTSDQELEHISKPYKTCHWAEISF